MTRPASRGATAQPARRRLGLAIEGAWLVGLVLLPLAFDANRWLVFSSEPKHVVLHFVALFIVVAWAFDLALSRRHRAGASEERSFQRLTGWAGRRPGRWAVLAALGFAVASVLSTLASPLPWVSLWGRDFSNLSNELYSQLSLLVIFFAIALRLRTISQARRVLYAIVGAGAVTAGYGAAQHFGWDPIGSGGGVARSYASFGNPVFFGSYLVMSAAVTLALIVDLPARRRNLWLVGLAAVLYLQVAALAFTLSRGSWFGFLAALVALAVIGWHWLDRRLLARAGAVLVGGIVGAAVLLTLPAGTVEGRRYVAAVNAAFAEADALGSGSTAIAGRRGAIWQGAVRLARTWDREPDEPTAQHLLRPVFGFGPEMYYYSYPLSVDLEADNEVASHAHNYPLHVFLELGLAGLATFVALLGSILWAGVRLLRRGGVGEPAAATMAILAAGALAALAGRTVEQMTGVARIADLAAFWALAGLIVAHGEIAPRSAPVAEPAAPRPRRRRPRRRREPARPAAVLGILAAVAIGVAGITLFLARDVRMLRAGRLAVRGYEQIEAGQGNRALDLFQRAVDLAPDVERYHLEVNWLLKNAALQASDPDTARAAYLAAYDAAARYERRDPYAYATQKRLATAAVDLSASGEPGMLSEIAARYLRLASMLPSFPDEQALAANGLVFAREYQLAVAAADRAIALEPQSNPVPQAWWARGEALTRLGRPEEAAVSFETAIERSPGSTFAARAHRGLAALSDEQGLSDEAEAHRARADEIEPAPVPPVQR